MISDCEAVEERVMSLAIKLKETLAIITAESSQTDEWLTTR